MWLNVFKCQSIFVDSNDVLVWYALYITALYVGIYSVYCRVWYRLYIPLSVIKKTSEMLFCSSVIRKNFAVVRYIFFLLQGRSWRRVTIGRYLNHFMFCYGCTTSSNTLSLHGGISKAYFYTKTRKDLSQWPPNPVDPLLKSLLFRPIVSSIPFPVNVTKAHKKISTHGKRV